MSYGLGRGTRRVGNLVDFNEETPEVKVTLERSGRGIGVTVPWSSLDSPYARWFLKDPHGMQDPQGTDLLPVPKRLLFQDSHGTVLLIGCRASGFHSDVLLGLGSGTVWARAAVLGPEGGYEFDRPNGLRTEISGLRAWLGVSSWEERHDWAEGRRIISYATQEPPPIDVGVYGSATLRFSPDWRVLREDDGDRRVLLGLVHCETRNPEPLGWDEHLKLHRAVRDLLVLSRWRTESCVEVLALREDDPSLAFDGTPHGVEWRSVVVPDDEPSAPPSGRRPHLIRYEDSTRSASCGGLPCAMGSPVRSIPSSAAWLCVAPPRTRCLRTPAQDWRSWATC